MTITDHILTPLPGSSAPAGSGRRVEPLRSIEVRWSCTASCLADRLPVPSTSPSPPGPHDRATIVIALDVLNRRRAMVEAWIEVAANTNGNGEVGRETGGAESSRQIILPARAAACSVLLDNDLIHLDARLGESRTLAVTLGPDDRVLYAQSDLIAQFTRGGGRYDPPAATRYAQQPRAARA